MQWYIKGINGNTLTVKHKSSELVFNVEIEQRPEGNLYVKIPVFINDKDLHNELVELVLQIYRLFNDNNNNDNNNNQTIQTDP